MAAPGLEGYLSKQGGGTSAFGRKSWKVSFSQSSRAERPQVRYFVLSKGVLNYYEDKKAYQKGTKPLVLVAAAMLTERRVVQGSNHVLQIMSIKTMPEKDKKFSNQVSPGCSPGVALNRHCSLTGRSSSLTAAWWCAATPRRSSKSGSTR